MKAFHPAGILIAGTVAMTAVGTSFAHVGYGSALYSGAGVADPLTGVIGTGTYGAAANFTSTASSNAGFLAGLDPYTLGNTHDMRFRYFTLSQTSTVSFTINGLTNANGSSTLNPAFSLYSGVVPASSHDGVGDTPAVAAMPNVATYLATAPKFAAWSPFAPVNGVRGGAAAGTPANPTGLWGVFDSNGNWATGNNNGLVGGVTYLGISGADAAAGSVIVDSLGNRQSVIGADGVVDNSVSWSGTLGPGVYTLAIGGANFDNYRSLVYDVRASLGGLDATAICGTVTCQSLYNSDRLARNLQIANFTVAAVPEPETWGMLLSGMAMVGAIARRRRQQA